ncbi:MAG: hypothetical protein L6R42_009618 [Xanthoria sp. 1 TBL-2021]|nr:MAG: hypothetical protein L6R42_009618 [Xanthoria sp. 1 TBL-2021]
MSRQLPLKRELSDSHQPEMKKTKLANSTKDHPAPIGAGFPYGGQKTNLTSSSDASAKEKEVDDFLASITAKSPHSPSDEEEDDGMDVLIRSSYGPQPEPSAFGQQQPPQPLSHGQQYAHSSSYDQQSRSVSSYGQQPLPSPFGRQQPQSSPNVQHSRPVSSYGPQPQPSAFGQQQRQLPPSRQQHEVQSYHGRKRSHSPPRLHPRRNPAPIGDGPMQEHIELGQPDTDEDMADLLRSLCPDNLEGQKCKQNMP